MLTRVLRDWWRSWRDGRKPDGAREALRLYQEGVRLGDDNRLDEAADHYRQALAFDPGLAKAINNLGRIYELRGRNAEAAECYEHAINCEPALPHPYINLGNLLQRSNNLDAACERYDAALALEPGNWRAHNNRANVLLERGEHAAARAGFAAALALRPDDPVAASNKLNCDIEARASAPAGLFEDYLEWGRRFADPLAAEIPVHDNVPDPQRKLRIGYVSPDFRKHAMGYFLEPLIEFHNTDAFEVYCYSNWPRPDTMTERFKSLAHEWRDIASVSNADVARQIVDDRIDLLVDLAGHSSDNRLLIFARKPAPLQFTYLGYPNTTGVAAIDYRITDGLADPPGMTEANYVETLLRLPDSMWCYRAPEYMPEVGPLPVVAAGHVTFGSFNGFMKVNEGVIDVWAKLLNTVPGSRLLVITVALGQTQARLRAAFAERGVDAGRLELHPKVSVDDYLALRNRVDIALDSFPMNGGTTTCDSLWMGVPTVTLAGRVFVARAGVSLLSTVGLPELIADTADEYVAIAAALATDLPRLRLMRAGLRKRMRDSPLSDAPRFVSNLERLYRDAWNTWCAAITAQGKFAQQNVAGSTANSSILP